MIDSLTSKKQPQLLQIQKNQTGGRKVLPLLAKSSPPVKEEQLGSDTHIKFLKLVQLFRAQNKKPKL